MNKGIFTLFLKEKKHSEYNSYAEIINAANGLAVADIKKTDIIIQYPEGWSANSNNQVSTN